MIPRHVCVEVGLERPIVLVATAADREALHVARVAHRYRVWTNAEVAMLRSWGVTREEALAIALTREQFRGTLVGVTRLSGDQLSLGLDVSGKYQHALIPKHGA